MLYHSPIPLPGRHVDLRDSPFAPPEPMGEDEYRGYLRALYKRKPSLFLNWASHCRFRDQTLTGPPELLPILYDALTKVAQSQSWNIAGDSHPSAPSITTPSDRSTYANTLDTYTPTAPP